MKQAFHNSESAEGARIENLRLRMIDTGRYEDAENYCQEYQLSKGRKEHQTTLVGAIVTFLGGMVTGGVLAECVRLALKGEGKGR